MFFTNNNFPILGHNSFVNSCHPARRGPQLIASGSDDCSIKIWDARKKGQAVTLNNTYQVTAVSFSDTAEQVLSGGIDNDIKVTFLYKVNILYSLSTYHYVLMTPLIIILFLLFLYVYVVILLEFTRLTLNY